MRRPEFDKYSQTYSQDITKALGVFSREHDFFVRSKSAILLSALATLDKDISTLRVLDVGCGIGLVHHYIAGRVGKLEGVDVSGASLAVARQSNPDASYREYDGNVLPYGDSDFDCAFAICVMHHVAAERWPAFLSEMRRVVRPGGLIVIVEHNPLNPATQWVVRTNEIDADAELVTPWTLRALLKSIGVSRFSTKFVLFTPFEGRLFRWLDRTLSWLPLGAQYAIVGHV
jgi:SAM-dependent methyltransferase